MKASPRRLTAGLYFVYVALATTAALGSAVWFRPTLTRAVWSRFGLAHAMPVAPDSFYAMRVAPLFQEHCTSCHGPQRQKAGLRLDNLTAALMGGKHGKVIEPGQVETSELWARIRLPPTDAKIMPPNSKPAMSLDEITVFKLWIAAGASGVVPVTDIRGAPPPIRRVTVAEIDTAVVERERAPLAATLKELQSRFPTVIGYESRGSADVEVNASLLGSAFGDRELAALAPLAERIVRLDLSDTAVSDASAALLRAMSRLRVVRLMHTKVTEAALMPLRTRGVKIYAEALTA